MISLGSILATTLGFVYSTEELASHAPAAVFANLAETQAVVSAILA